jgi:hypothetical protein
VRVNAAHPGKAIIYTHPAGRGDVNLGGAG